MSLVSQQQLLQNQLQLKQLENQRTKQVQQSRSLVSSVATANTAATSTSHQSQSLNHGQNQNQDPQKSQSNVIDASASANARSSSQFSNPLAITIPTHANPSDILAARFNSWRIIISALSHYLQETVSVHEEITRQQIRLHHAISFPFVTQGLDGELYQPMHVANQSAQNQNSKFFHSGRDQSSAVVDNASVFTGVTSTANGDQLRASEFDLAQRFFLPLGSGSIQDLPTVLYQYHSNSALLAQSTVKELNATIIPRLEDLKRDLLVKIKEIRSLQSDFKNQVVRYQSETARLLSSYVKSIDSAKIDSSQLDPKNDPYLLKFALDRSIRRQLTEENYLHEAFLNIQTSGRELEKVVSIEVQTALTVYAKLLGQQAQNVFDNLISKLDSTILTKDPALEWDSFIERDHNNFIELDLPMRKTSDIKYKYQNESLTYEIRSGWLERKSKFLKSYQRAWYVLTPCFLHEFKSSDRRKDPLPERSLLLSELSVSEHSKKDEKNPNSYHKFVIIHGQGSGLLHKGHNWVFRAESYDLMMSWYNDIKKVTQMSGPVARASIAIERKKARRSVGNFGAGDSSATSIATGRKRGVSSATAQTSHTEVEQTFKSVPEVPEHPDPNPVRSIRSKHASPSVRNSMDYSHRSNALSRIPTGISSASGILDHNDVVVMPVKTDIGDAPSHQHGQISNLTTLSPLSNIDNMAVASSTLNSATPAMKQSTDQTLPSSSFAEQQALLLQQQALLEQKQRQLLEEQRELQQRAFSLTSSVQQQYQQQHQQQHQQQQPLNPINMSSEVSGISATNVTPNGKVNNVEELSEKVGELGIDESR